MNKKAKIQENKAITLIALVITIIVLIILAGVAINLTLGQNGLVARTKMARGEYSTAEAKEKLEQEILNVQIQAVQEGKEFNLKYLKEKIDKTKYEITLDDEENPTTAVVKEIGSNYYLTVDSKLKVTKVEEQQPKPQYVKFSELTWISGKASVELSTKEAGTIEYKVGKDGIYQVGTTISNLSNGDIVYVRVNNNGTYTDEETLEIKDTILPEEFTITTSDITYEGVKLTGSTQDLQTGIKDYIYVAETKTNEIVKEVANQTVTEYTITGLDPETEYVVYMLAYDNAGNVRKSNETEVKTLEIPKVEAGDIAEDASYYGKIVSNYTCENDMAVSGWQIYYADEKNIYLIAKDPIINTYAPNGRKGTELTRSTDKNYVVSFNNIVNDYDGAKDIVKNTKVSKWISWANKYSTSENYNIKAVAYLLDTDIWSKFKSEEADYVIGGPTAELYISSIKKYWKYKGNPINSATITLYQNGEQIYYPGNSDKVTQSLYHIEKNYWMASPSYLSSGNVYAMTENGNNQNFGISAGFFFRVRFKTYSMLKRGNKIRRTKRWNISY